MVLSAPTHLHDMLPGMGAPCLPTQMNPTLQTTHMLEESSHYLTSAPLRTLWNLIKSAPAAMQWPLRVEGDL